MTKPTPSRGSPPPLAEPLSAQATGDYPLGSSPSRGPLVVPKVSTLPGALPSLGGEIRDLLQARLRVISILAIVGWFTLIALFLSRVDALLNTDVLSGWILRMAGFTAAVATVCAVVLYARQGLTLAWLRVHEALLFGLSAIALGWLRHATLDRALDDTLVAPASRALAVDYATAFSNLSWMTLIVVYGVFIPNTWQRTLHMVGGMALLVGAIDILGWTTHAPLVGQGLVAPLVQTFLTLFMSLGTACFGSFRIGTLHQEAVTARQ
jgi:hypothetical protein